MDWSTVDVYMVLNLSSFFIIISIQAAILFYYKKGHKNFEMILYQKIGCSENMKKAYKAFAFFNRYVKVHMSLAIINFITCKYLFYDMAVPEIWNNWSAWNIIE